MKKLSDLTEDERYEVIAAAKVEGLSVDDELLIRYYTEELQLGRMKEADIQKALNLCIGANQ